MNQSRETVGDIGDGQAAFNPNPTPSARPPVPGRVNNGQTRFFILILVNTYPHLPVTRHSVYKRVYSVAISQTAARALNRRACKR